MNKTPAGRTNDQNKWERTRIVIVGILVLFAFILAVVLGFGWTGWDPAKDTLPYETGKLFVQASLVGGLAALISYLVDLVKTRESRRIAVSSKAADERRQDLADEAARQAAKREFEIALLERFLEKLDLAYRNVKTVRRRLTAGFGKDHDGSVPRQTLYRSLDGLSAQAQLDLEQLVKDAEVLQLHVPELRPVRQEIRTMESYLSKLWSDVERHMPQLANRVRLDAGPTLERISPFVSRATEARQRKSEIDRGMIEKSMPAQSGNSTQLGATETAQGNEKMPRRGVSPWFRPGFADPYHAARDLVVGGIGARLLSNEVGESTSGDR